MNKTLLTVMVVAAFIGCSSSSSFPDGSADAAPPSAVVPAVPDSRIGLAAGTAFEQPPQAPIPFNTTDPGESEIPARPNPDFPPVIPHSIEGLEIITRTHNTCLDCHAAETAADFGATAVPASHRVDLRRSPDSEGEAVVGARWVCTSCHVAQTDAAPLVDTTS